MSIDASWEPLAPQPWGGAADNSLACYREPQSPVHVVHANAPTKMHSSVTGWVTPPRLLLLFCLTTLLLFGDHGCVSSNSVNNARSTTQKPGYGTHGDFDLDLFRDGLLAAALMLGLMLSAPVAALLIKRANSLRLVGAGLGCWVIGAAAIGLAPNFPLLLACAIVGCGTGPFIEVAAPLIDDCAPHQQKSIFLALLFLCFPAGFALSYMYGGIVGTTWGWRAAFLLEAAAMAPLCVQCLLGLAVDIKRNARWEGDPLRLGKALAADLRALLRHTASVLTILQMAVYNDALGCYAYYRPKAARDVFNLRPETHRM